jgi:hypothetical protein
MKCAFCQAVFDERDVRRVCQSCAMFGGCQKVKCPQCGMEAPAEPASLKWLRNLLSRRPHEQSSR